MKYRTGRSALVLAGLALAALAAGCSDVGADRRSTAAPAAPVAAPAAGRTPLRLPDRTIDELRAEIAANSASFISVQSDCECTITSRLLLRPLTYQGRISIQNPLQIRLVLTDKGRTRVDLIGDGKRYLVDMPGIGKVHYFGVYDAPLVTTPGRLAMMPDDIAEAFDQREIFSNETLSLKQFPWWWIIEGITVAEGKLVPTGTYWVKRERAPGEVQAPCITTYHRFDLPSGEIRCMVNLSDYRNVIDTKGGRTCALPMQVKITYPNEGTVIDITLKNPALNQAIPKSTFDVPAMPAKTPAPAAKPAVAPAPGR